ncbi:hypothetical protein ACFQXA_38535 [Nocardiopsis composta]
MRTGISGSSLQPLQCKIRSVPAVYFSAMVRRSSSVSCWAVRHTAVCMWPRPHVLHPGRPAVLDEGGHGAVGDAFAELGAGDGLLLLDDVADLEREVGAVTEHDRQQADRVEVGQAVQGLVGDLGVSHRAEFV